MFFEGLWKFDIEYWLLEIETKNIQ